MRFTTRFARKNIAIAMAILFSIAGGASCQSFLIDLFHSQEIDHDVAENLHYIISKLIDHAPILRTFSARRPVEDAIFNGRLTLSHRKKCKNIFTLNSSN